MALRALDGADQVVIAVGDDGAPTVTVLGRHACALTVGIELAIDATLRALARREADTAGFEELRTWARIDELTGALNRRALFEHLDACLARDQPVTLVLCDLDGLKAINDRYGHPVGDAALQAFVKLLSSNLRASDAVGRVGGDEFALVLPGAGIRAVVRIVGRLSTTIADAAAGVADVRASFGVAWCPDDGCTRAELLAAADRRLYDDKRRDDRVPR